MTEAHDRWPRPSTLWVAAVLGGLLGMLLGLPYGQAGRGLIAGTLLGLAAAVLVSEIFRRRRDHG